jgi:hypothetical protein
MLTQKTTKENEMEEHNSHSESQFRDFLINRIAVMTAVFTASAYLFSIPRSIDLGWSLRDIFFIILISCAIGIALGRQKFSTRFKTFSIIILFILAGFTGLYSFGMLAGAVFYFVLVAMIIAIFYTKRAVVVYGVSSIIFLCLVAYGFISNVLRIPSGADLLHTRYSHWIVYILAFGLSNVIICWTILTYRAGMRKLIENVNSQKDKLEKSNQDLQHALSEVRALRGILPLCSFCKKIRDAKGYWKPVDEYIYEHSEADISHSVCPECMKEHYPEEYEEIK